MALSSNGALSFKVVARVGKGEQVRVCGGAPFLGAGDPDRALPLFTTPADYPLWFSKEDLPQPLGRTTAYDYRYCVFRGGRFHRWDKFEQPRVIRHSRTPHIARDTLDGEPLPVQSTENDDSSKDARSGKTADGGDGDEGCTPGGGQKFRPRSSTAAEAAANAVALLQQGSACIELSPAETDPSEAFAENDIGGGGAFPPCGGEEELFRRRLRRHPQAGQEYVHNDNGGDADGEYYGGCDGSSEVEVARLQRPPSLEAVDDGGAGLGLGLRLGVEATTMSTPPPGAAAAGSAAAAADKSKASPPQWSPRDGGVVVASFYLPVTLRRYAPTRRGHSGGAEREGGAHTDAAAAGAGGGTAAEEAEDPNACDDWTAEWDHEQLIALQTDLRVVRIGTVRYDKEIRDEDKAAVAKALLRLNCVPVFLSKSLAHECYYSYCKGVLWPVMHGMLEMYDALPYRNTLLDDKAITSGWQAYKEVNKAFRDKVVEVFHDGDMIWVHGFHLAILPAFLDRTVKVARIGLFLHTPFPPSEVFRALPHREDLLRGMLGADQVGFHRFADSQHFMSSCRRLLGLTHVRNQETGLVQIVHGGKPTILTDRHAGVDPEAIRASLREKGTKDEVARLERLHEGHAVVGGIERVEKIKGVWLKMLAFEDMLRRYPHLVGRVSMHEVGIANPARGSDYRACQEALSELAGRVNTTHGPGTVVYEERDAKYITLSQRAALMSVSSVFVKTPVHNGLSTMPIEFRVVQEHRRQQPKDDRPSQHSGEPSPASSAPGVLILSEAVSCSPALHGSFSVNPWQVQTVADAMALALTADKADRTAWHEEDADWCESNTTAKWAEDVLGVLATVAKEDRTRYATTGLGFTSRVVGMDPTFKRLDTNCTRRAYGLSKSRVFFLDYGGTLAKEAKDTKPPSNTAAAAAGLGGSSSSSNSNGGASTSRLRPGRAVVEGLTNLCRDPSNLVFVVSGRGKAELQEAFGHIKGLGLAAEHGSFFRWPRSKPAHAFAGRGDSEDGGSENSASADGGGWEALHPGLVDTAWKDVVRRFMRDFQLHTHGSYIEEKGTAMLWHYGDAEPEFGAMQAKQLQDELTDVLRSSADYACASTNSRQAETESLSVNIYRYTNVPIGKNTDAKSVDTIPAKHNSSASSKNLANMSVCGTGITGSTRSSSSVASEGLGSIEIIHEEGLNSEDGGGAYLEVRARGASKGNFVHMVLGRLAWPIEGAAAPSTPDATAAAGGDGEGSSESPDAAAPSGRFCLCVGDDVSDEDMFIAVKSYEGSAATPNDHNGSGWGSSTPATCSPTATPLAAASAVAPVNPNSPSSSPPPSSGKENLYPYPAGTSPHKVLSPPPPPRPRQYQQQHNFLLTATVGSKPSDADAWLPGVDAVVSLLRSLGRLTFRDGTTQQRSKFSAHAAALAGSSAPLVEMETRGAHSMSPARNFRSASASNAEGADATAATANASAAIRGRRFFMAGVAEGEDGGSSGGGGGTLGTDMSMANRAAVMTSVGMGMPVVRRHSYSTGMAVQPRIALSLGEFLRQVAQPEPEPPMF